MKIIYHRFFSNAEITVLGFVLAFYMLLVWIGQGNSTNPKSHFQIGVLAFQAYFQMLG